MGEGMDNEKNDQGSTTITFRIRANEKQQWQVVANQWTQGSITRFIKRAVSRYVHDRMGPLTLLREKNSEVHKYFRKLFEDISGSTDPAVVQAKWDKERPKIIAQCFQQFDEQLQRIQEQFKTELNHILTYQIQFE